MATEKRERKDNIVTGHLPLILSKVQRFAARSATHFFLNVTCPDDKSECPCANTAQV